MEDRLVDVAAKKLENRIALALRKPEDRAHEPAPEEDRLSTGLRMGPDQRMFDRGIGRAKLLPDRSARFLSEFLDHAFDETRIVVPHAQATEEGLDRRRQSIIGSGHRPPHRIATAIGHDRRTQEGRARRFGGPCHIRMPVVGRGLGC